MLLGPRLLHRDIAMKTVVNLSTPRKLSTSLPFQSRGLRGKAAAQRKKRKQSAKVRCVGGNNGGADLESHGMVHQAVVNKIVDFGVRTQKMRLGNFLPNN